jgi:hypothetical protein
MAEWTLQVGDKSQYALVAVLDEKRISAGGDIVTPSLVLPLQWDEFLPTSARQRADQRVQAVSFDMQPSNPQNQYTYWVRTGFLPVSRAIEPTLPLSASIIEALNRSTQGKPDADIVLNLRVWALATIQGSPGSVATHWCWNPQPVSIGPAKWKTMLAQWAK